MNIFSLLVRIQSTKTYSPLIFPACTKPSSLAKGFWSAPLLKKNQDKTLKIILSLQIILYVIMICSENNRVEV